MMQNTVKCTDKCQQGYHAKAKMQVNKGNNTNYSEFRAQRLVLTVCASCNASVVSYSNNKPRLTHSCSNRHQQEQLKDSSIGTAQKKSSVN